MRVACSSFSYHQAFQRGGFRLKDFLCSAWEIGVAGVELNDGYLLREGLPLSEIKRNAVALALDIVAVDVECNFYRDTEAEIDAEREKILDWLDHAYFLGAPLLRVNTCQPHHVAAKPGLPRERVFRWAVDTFHAVLPEAERRGIVLALENHYGITSTSADVLTLVEAVGSPWFRVNIDPGNFADDPMTGAHPFEDAYEATERLAPLIVLCHAKIRGLTPDNSNDSILDYRRILSILQAAGYKGYVSVEYMGKEDPVKAMPTVVRMLCSLLPDESESL